MKKLILWLAASIGATCIAVALGFSMLQSWANSPNLAKDGDLLVEVQPGISLKSLARRLSEKSLVSNEHAFRLWIKYTGDYEKFQAGTYKISNAITPDQLRFKFISGDVYIPNVLQVTVPEGFMLRQLIDRLATKNVGKRQQLRNLVSNRKFMRSLGIESNTLEGYTYPATYNFESFPTPEEFFRKTVKTFFDRLPRDYERNVNRLNLTLTQAVTFASLIELETMRAEEKPLIAEVIWSRLKNNEALGIDAAIIYGIENYDGDLRRSDLKNEKNPYNTRVHRGLPPSPIGAVTISSLEAVLNPSHFGYYYYVLNADDQTRHLFSKTLAEHNSYVKRLINKSESRLRKRDEE